MTYTCAHLANQTKSRSSGGSECGLTWNSTAAACSVAERGRMAAPGRRSLASAVRQYQKNSECHGSRLVL